MGAIIEQATDWLEVKLADTPATDTVAAAVPVIPEGYVSVEAVATLLEGKTLQWREGPSFDSNSYRNADAGSFVRSHLGADSSPR
jgi:hypothetical protein